MKLSEIKKECVKFAKLFCKKYNLVKSQIVNKSLISRNNAFALSIFEPDFGVKVYGKKEIITHMLNDCYYVDENGFDVDIKEEKNGLASVILPYHFEESFQKRS